MNQFIYIHLLAKMTITGDKNIVKFQHKKNTTRYIENVAKPENW